MTQTATTVTQAKEDVKKDVKQKVDTLADKNVDSTDSDIRYAAYGARLRTALRAGGSWYSTLSIVEIGTVPS